MSTAKVSSWQMGGSWGRMEEHAIPPGSGPGSISGLLVHFMLCFAQKARVIRRGE